MQKAAASWFETSTPIGAWSAPFTCSLGATFHLCGMPTDFSLFRDRFAEACRVRDMKPDAVYRSVGIGVIAEFPERAR